MKRLLLKRRLPKNDLAFAVDPPKATTSHSLPRNWAAGLGKRFGTPIGVLVAVVATSGWLYFLTLSIRAFVSWL
jgi:hypothetical protein